MPAPQYLERYLHDRSIYARRTSTTRVKHPRYEVMINYDHLEAVIVAAIGEEFPDLELDKTSLRFTRDSYGCCCSCGSTPDGATISGKLRS